MASTGRHVNRLVGNRVLIIGGTGGIGFGVALAALESSMSIFITGSTSDKLVKSIAQLRSTYPELATEIDGATLDLSNLDTVEESLSTLLDKVKVKGSINHIVHVAGDLKMMPHVKNVTTDDIKDGIAIRFATAVILAKLAPQYMAQRPENSLVFTSGTAANRPYPGRAIMSAFALAQEGLVKGLAIDLKPMRIVAVSPGAIQTPVLSVFVPPPAIDSFLENLAQQTVTNEVGQPEWIAEAYIYAMKDRFCTGTTILSDGGRGIAPSPYIGELS